MSRSEELFLPAISRPQSPEFPSIVRSRASSPQLTQLPAPVRLQATASCPQLRAQVQDLRREEEKNFLARQQKHSALQSRRQRSMMQREFLRQSHDADNVEFLGAKGKEGFHTWLQKKFGSILRGWRALDTSPDCAGRLGFHEFCHVCRAVGFHGNFKKLWAELDTKKNGTVSLADVDAEAGKYLRSFKLALLKKGDLATVWFQHIDVGRDGHVQEAAFVEAVQRLGVDLEPLKLFHMLKGPSAKGVSLSDVDPDVWKKYMAGDSRDEPKEEEKKDEKLSQVPNFKQALCRRFGSLWAAWKEALDVDSKGKLTFGEFCFSLNRLGFHCEVRTLWSQLTTEEFLRFRDLDPQMDAMLRDLRERLTQEYGNMLLAWIKGLDTKGNGSVSEKKFVQCCRKAGVGAARELFRRMQLDGGRGGLSLRDFDTKAFRALSRGDFRMLSQPRGDESNPKSPTELTFHQRNEAGFFYQMARARMVSTGPEFAKICGTQSTSSKSLETLEDFEDLCVRKYGSLTAAWRCLDVHASGRLASGEFCAGLRRLGYTGDVRALFKTYDRQGRGFVCLGDIDPEADEMVSDFLRLLGEHFGTLDAAWKDGFHQDPHGSITKKDLVEACASLGYSHDAQKLFKCLQTQKNCLTIWDLDPACSQKRQSGHTAIISGADKKSVTVEDASNSSRSKVFHSFEAPSQVQLLHRSLKLRYGSTAQAWRSAFDAANHGTCGFGVFMKALEECAFTGKPKKLWEQLSGSRAFINFQDLDGPVARFLTSVREELLEKFGSLMDAWYALEEAAGILDEENFVSALKSQGVRAAPGRLFKLLLSWPGQRTLVMEDLHVLLIGVPALEQENLWRSKKEKPKAQKAQKAQKDPKDSPKDRKVPKKRKKESGEDPQEAPQAPPTSPVDASPTSKAPPRSEAARSVARQTVDEVLASVAANLESETSRAAPPASPAAAAAPARKRFAASLLSAAKDGRLEKSLQDFEAKEE